VTNVEGVNGLTASIAGDCITVSIGPAGHGQPGDEIGLIIFFETSGACPTIVSACFEGV
jgi:hypothetical protein